MAFPTGVSISTTNLDSSADDPSAARADILTAVQTVNSIVSSAGTANGVALLNGSTQIDSTNMPSTLAPASGVLTLAPVDGVVKIEDRLRLQVLDTDTVNNLASPVEGDICYVNDGDSTLPCLAVYDGSDWRRINLGEPIQV